MIPETQAQRLKRLTDAACSADPDLDETERRGVLKELRRMKRRQTTMDGDFEEQDTEHGDPPPRAAVG